MHLPLIVVYLFVYIYNWSLIPLQEPTGIPLHCSVSRFLFQSHRLNFWLKSHSIVSDCIVQNEQILSLNRIDNHESWYKNESWLKWIITPPTCDPWTPLYTTAGFYSLKHLSYLINNTHTHTQTCHRWTIVFLHVIICDFDMM